MEHIDPAILKLMPPGYREVPLLAVTEDCQIGERVTLSPFVNLYGCRIGNDTKIGAYTEIGRNVVVGKGCKIQAHCFVCTGVTIGDNVFVGPRVTFTNDRLPAASGAWKLEETRVEDGAVIGAASCILPGLTIGRNAFIAAGSVVTKDVPEEGHWKGTHLS